MNKGRGLQQQCQYVIDFRAMLLVKGALDKSNIYLYISSSIDDLKSKQYRKFQLILPMCFHFMRYFVNCITFRVSHRLLFVYLLKSTLKNR